MFWGGLPAGQGSCARARARVGARAGGGGGTGCLLELDVGERLTLPEGLADILVVAERRVIHVALG